MANKEYTILGTVTFSAPEMNYATSFSLIGKVAREETPKQIKGGLIEWIVPGLQKYVGELSQKMETGIIFTFDVKVLPKKEGNLVSPKKNELIFLVDSSFAWGKTISEVLLPEMIFNGQDTNLLETKKDMYVFEKASTGERYTIRMIKA